VSRPTLLGDDTIASFLSSHPRWRLEGHRLRCDYHIPYNEALDVLLATRDVVRERDHHPVCEVGYNGLSVTLWTHDRGGVTELDLVIATAFDLAVEGG